MPSLRTRTVSTKVTEDDYALFAQLAGDQSVGEWVREVLFKAVLAERTAEAHRTILGEVLALRKILLNLQFTVAAGEPVTRDRMLAWIEEADADKGEKARARLTAAPPGRPMDHSWGRQASAGTWISTRPAWALSAALIAVVSVIGLGQYRYSRWTPLQRFYFPAYATATQQWRRLATAIGRILGPEGPSAMWSRRRRSDSDFAEEIAANIAIDTDRLIAEGMTPADAQAAAYHHDCPDRVCLWLAVGLYAVAAHAVVDRTREMGLRMALGAHPAHVVWRGLRGALWQLGAGVVLGTLGVSCGPSRGCRAPRMSSWRHWHSGHSRSRGSGLADRRTAGLLLARPPCDQGRSDDRASLRIARR